MMLRVAQLFWEGSIPPLYYQFPKQYLNQERKKESCQFGVVEWFNKMREERAWTQITLTYVDWVRETNQDIFRIEFKMNCNCGSFYWYTDNTQRNTIIGLKVEIDSIGSNIPVHKHCGEKIFLILNLTLPTLQTFPNYWRCGTTLRSVGHPTLKYWMHWKCQISDN